MAFLPVLAAAGAAVSAVGEVSSGLYQAQIARNNAKIAKQNAEEISRASQIDQARSDREYAALEGEQIAAQSASGLNLTGRTSTAVRTAQHAVGREQAMDIYTKGTAGARDQLQKAAQFKAQAGADTAGAVLSGIGGALSVGQSLTGGASSVIGSRKTSITSRGRR